MIGVPTFLTYQSSGTTKEHTRDLSLFGLKFKLKTVMNTGNGEMWNLKSRYFTLRRIIWPILVPETFMWRVNLRVRTVKLRHNEIHSTNC